MVIVKYYGPIDNILRFGLKRAIKFINEALKKKQEEEHWQLYVSVYPHFDSKSFMNFTNFRKAITGNYEPTMTQEDKDRIDKQVERARRKFDRKG